MNIEHPILRHGGQLDAMAAAFPNAPLPWIDLSTGINPFPYPVPPVAKQAWTRLPTAADRARCEEAMAARFGCNSAHCRAVPGTEIVIRQLPAILGSSRVAVRHPSYADHMESWARSGANILTMDNPLDAVADVDAIVLVNPNNPDGQSWSADEIEAARKELASRGGWLILDEAYADLDPGGSMAPKAGRDSLVILRSFGKFFGLPGVRLGAALAPQPILAALDEKLGDWNVSGPALLIGTAAYSDNVWQDKTCGALADAAQDLSRILADAGVEELGGTDLFRYVRTKNATAIWSRLAEQGIAVRRFAKDNEHLRIGIPHADERQRFMQALNP